MNNSRINVLLVEDDPLYAELVRESVENSRGADLELGWVPTWKQAIASLNRNRFDAILLDLHLPDTQGLETIHKALSSASHLPIVVLTGLDDRELALEAVRLGAQDLLEKNQVNGPILAQSLRYAIERKQILEDLKQSEAQYRSLVQHVREGIFQTDCELNWTFLNPAWEQLTGFSLEESLGKPSGQFVHPDDRDRHERKLKELFAQTEVSSRYQVRWLTNQGQVRWCEVHAQLYSAPDGSILGTAGILNDITARYLAQSSLENSMGLLRATFESTADGILAVDSRGNLTNWNRKLVEMCCPPDMKIDREDESAVLALVLAQLGDRDGFLQNTAHLKTPEAETFDILTLKDGRTIERYSHPCRVGDEIIGRVWSFRDVSDRQHAQEAVRASEEQFRTLVANIPGAVYRCACDRQWTMEFISGEIEQICGYSPADLIGNQEHSFASVIHPDDRDRVERDVHNAVSNRVPYLLEYRIITSDGMIRWVSEKGQGIFTPSGELQWLDGAIFDITKRKEAEAALRYSEAIAREKAQQLELAMQELKLAQTQLVHHEKMAGLGQLVAGVAHEINNPVGFIYSNAMAANEYAQELLELLALYESTYPEPPALIRDWIADMDLAFVREDFPRLLQSMRSGADRIGKIVKSLRQFSRLDEAEYKKVDLHEGLDGALLVLQHRLQGGDRRRAIEVVKAYGELPRVECYGSEINQVFVNILSNAIDALEEAWERRSRDRPSPEASGESESWIPRIAMMTETIDNGGDRCAYARIRIRDNGLGIPPQVRDRVFDPFFTTKPVGKGTGMGLSVAYSTIVNQHQGRLECHSTPGEGTEFAIVVPLYPQDRPT